MSTGLDTNNEVQQKSDPRTDSDTEDSNILTLVLHQVLFRVAWIFKTESVMMPAFLDSITSTWWIRGMLPPLNRFAQSLAPLMLSDRLSRTSRKSSWLARTTFCMSLPFLALGIVQYFWGANPPAWFPAFFLLAYTIFFCLHGVNQMSFNTIQGKLIRPNRRGHLMMLVGYFGSPAAVLMAWLLLRPWTQTDPPQYAAIFLFTGTAFLLASLTLGRLQEVADPVVNRSAIDMRRRFRDAAAAIRHDVHLRRLCLFAALFVSSQTLFPHYQRLGRSQPGHEGQMLMIWVIAQNLSAAIFSWISGRVADRLGTRSAIRWLSFAAMFAPALALTLHRHTTAHWFWIAFVWLGLVPVTFRMQLNHALELTDRSRHPIYVSTVVLCMAAPIVLSPLVGELVGRVGYAIPFLSITAVVFAAWCLSLTMIEPRDAGFEPVKWPEANGSKAKP